MGSGWSAAGGTKKRGDGVWTGEGGRAFTWPGMWEADPVTGARRRVPYRRTGTDRAVASVLNATPEATVGLAMRFMHGGRRPQSPQVRKRIKAYRRAVRRGRRCQVAQKQIAVVVACSRFEGGA
jgi:hypothetical protein